MTNGLFGGALGISICLISLTVITVKRVRSIRGSALVHIKTNGVFCSKILLFLLIVKNYNTHKCIHASPIVVLNRYNSVDFVNVCKTSIM